MFTNISWSSYLLFVALLLAAWYLFVGIRYYFAELQALASGKISFFRQNASSEEQPAINQAKTDRPVAYTASPEEMEALSFKLTEAITSAAAKHYPKEEFIFLLQLVLKDFPQLSNPPYKAAIHNLITSECDKQGFIRLNDDELELLWKA